MVLTEAEKALAANAAVMFTKNKIIGAVYELFGELSEEYKVHAAALPAEFIVLHPKISKGESYLGLPWVMLDYPRFFQNRNALAIRTMFWWGHYFSLHLLLQGDQLPLLKTHCLPDGWYFSTAANPWQHHLNIQMAVPSEQVNSDILQQQAMKGFYKLSSYLPISDWEKATGYLKNKFEEAVQMLRLEKPEVQR